MRKTRSKTRQGGLNGKKVLLIVTGGIAAYKSVLLVRLLKQSGADVRVVLTDAAAHFVTPLTFETVSGNPVSHSLFAPHADQGVFHIELASWAERVVIAPATADFLSKAARGAGDDLASTLLLAVRCPVYACPSMNSAMWEHPAVRRNAGLLERDAVRFIDPASGELACGEAGPGRMAEPKEIVRVLESSFSAGDLHGVRVLVTAGRTEEDIDPVRYISNRSSGRMGFALAGEARRRGAHVTLIHGTVDITPPPADAVQAVRSAAEMKSAVNRAFPRCDVLLMAAAVSDFAPSRRAASKLRRAEGALTLSLRPTDDILATLAEKKRTGQVVVGFALETDDDAHDVQGKMKRKGCDYIVLNSVGERTGFSAPTNQVTLFRGGRRLFASGVVSKEKAASMILDAVASGARIRRAKR